MSSKRKVGPKAEAAQELLLREYEMALGALREPIRKEVAKALLRLSTALESREELRVISKRFIEDMLKLSENIDSLTEAEKLIWSEDPKAYVELFRRLLLDGRLTVDDFEVEVKLPKLISGDGLLPSLIFKETFSPLEPNLSAQLARKLLRVLKASE